jgi:hypothetical protein
VPDPTKIVSTLRRAFAPKKGSGVPYTWKVILFLLGFVGQFITTTWLYVLGCDRAVQFDPNKLILAYAMNVLCMVLMAPTLRWAYFYKPPKEKKPQPQPRAERASGANGNDASPGNGV